MTNHTFKQYDPEDHNFIYQTKKIVYQKYVEQNWGEWVEEKQQEMFINFINAYKNDIRIILVDDEKIGFWHGNNIDKNNFELGNICILPKFQDKGIGTKIMQQILENHKTQNIHLQCFKQNPVERLYKRLGFEKTDETEFHIKMILKKQI